MEALRERPKCPTGQTVVAARAAPAPFEPDPAIPWERPHAEWEILAPKSRYARRYRTPFLYGVTLLLLPFALLAGLPVALVNFFVHGSLRRILFTQERIGLRGRPFTIYKFRTMRGKDGAPESERVTSFGRFLRNTHLDELPQFINVLLGDMCLIGPRPEMSKIEGWAAEALPRFSERLVLRPGITGWAQITQGYAADGDGEAYQRKLTMNRVYRSRLKWRTDVAILVRTVMWMALRRGWRPREFFAGSKPKAKLNQAA